MMRQQKNQSKAVISPYLSQITAKIIAWAEQQKADALIFFKETNHWRIELRRRGHNVSELQIQLATTEKLPTAFKNLAHDWLALDFAGGFYFKRSYHRLNQDSAWFIHPSDRQNLRQLLARPQGIWLIGGSAEAKQRLANWLVSQLPIDQWHAVNCLSAINGVDNLKMPRPTDAKRLLYRHLAQQRPNFLRLPLADCVLASELLNNHKRSLILVDTDESLSGGLRHLALLNQSPTAAILINQAPANCRHCRQTHHPDTGLRNQLALTLGIAAHIINQTDFWHGGGCLNCENSGLADAVALINLWDWRDRETKLTAKNWREAFNEGSTVSIADTLLAAATAGHLSPEFLPQLLSAINDDHF